MRELKKKRARKIRITRSWVKERVRLEIRVWSRRRKFGGRGGGSLATGLFGGARSISGWKRLRGNDD